MILQQIVTWCEAEGLAAIADERRAEAQLPGEAEARASIVVDGSGVRVTNRFEVVPAGDDAMDQRAALLDQVTLSRPGMVAVTADGDGTVVAEVRLLEGGITRHGVLTALTEVAKVRRLVIGAIADENEAAAALGELEELLAEQERQLEDLDDLLSEPHGTTPPPPPTAAPMPPPPGAAT